MRRRLNHHHSDAAIEDGGRDEAACLGRGPRICQGDDGVADSQCRPRQRNDGGVIDNLRRPAARSVARCNTSRVRSLAQLPRQLDDGQNSDPDKQTGDPVHARLLSTLPL